MPNILCPKCDSTLAIDDSSVGQMVQCGSCQNVFKAAVAAPPNDEDDERPSKRKSKRRDDDEDERPSKRRSSKRGDDDEDDDDEDRPRKKKSKKHYHDDDDDLDDAVAPTGSNGMATASLVLGIIAIVVELPSFGGTILGTAAGAGCACCVFCGVLFWPGHALAGILAIIGLILGILAMKKDGGKGAWMTGLITSAITLILIVLMGLLYLLGFAAIAATMPTSPATQNWNQPVQQPQPRPFPPKR